MTAVARLPCLAQMAADSAIAYKLLPTISYAAGLELMERTVERKQQDRFFPNVMYLLQHRPVYTAGRRIKNSVDTEGARLRALGADYYEVPRGGQTTFHGPGQLVGYPILDLGRLNLSVRCYVNAMEQTLIALCKEEYGLDAATNEHTGVWVGNNKIAALGVHVSDSVTSHGFALNVSTDMVWFHNIVPCGIQGKFVTSLTLELKRPVTIDEVVPKLLERWRTLWAVEMQPLKDVSKEWDQQVDLIPCSMALRGALSASQIREVLPQLLNEFKAPIRYAFAYGSAAFPQKGYDTGGSGTGNVQQQSSSSKKPMVDLVFGVTHPEHWHSLNLHQYRHHYSALGALGSSTIATVQESKWLGAGVYFNPFVEIQGLTVKYGVIGVDKLCKDLSEWETLYMAGRLHKPIHVVRPHSRIELCQTSNLLGALRVAFLLLPTTFTATDLYHTVASLSYLGDFRMRFKYLENPHKVYNIVYTQTERFEKIYRPLIEDEFAGIVDWQGSGPDANITVDDNVRVRGVMVGRLPKQFLDRVKLQHKQYLATEGRIYEDLADGKFAQSIANSPHIQDYLRKSLHKTIATPALLQSVKGIFTAGPTKTIKYAAAKIGKGIKGSSRS
ncbi:Mitochondrial translocator assembly and maintenance protein 41 [Sorochytrium milnesiophthora]